MPLPSYSPTRWKLAEIWRTSVLHYDPKAPPVHSVQPTCRKLCSGALSWSVEMTSQKSWGKRSPRVEAHCPHCVRVKRHR